MKKILFLQHYKKEFPFDHWNNETFEQAVGLSKGEISKGIKSDINDFYTEYYPEGSLSQYEQIITSPVLRAKETAEFLQKQLQLNNPINETELLTEVTWDLSKHMSKAEFNQSKSSGIYNLGTKRLDTFISDNGISGLDSVYQRIIEFKQYLQTIESENIIVVSHSFLMKVVYLVFVKQLRNDEITSAHLLNTYKVKYLHGFKVEL